MSEIGPIYDENGWGSPLSIAVWSILFLTIITVVIFAVRRLRKRTNRNWQEAATELGLHFTPQQLFWLPYEMEGTLGIIGYYCKVHTLREHRAGGDSSGSHAPVTRVEVRFLESLGMEFSLRPGLGIKWLNWIDGSEDIEVGGDSDFDEQFEIYSTDELKLRRYLTAERKEILKAARHDLPYFEINDIGISIESDEIIRDKDAIIYLVTELRDLVEDLTSNGGEQEPDIFATPSEMEKSIFD